MERTASSPGKILCDLFPVDEGAQRGAFSAFGVDSLGILGSKVLGKSMSRCVWPTANSSPEQKPRMLQV